MRCFGAIYVYFPFQYLHKYLQLIVDRTTQVFAACGLRLMIDCTI